MPVPVIAGLAAGDLSEYSTEPLWFRGGPVANKIRKGAAFWHQIADPERDYTVLRWVDEGYRLEWDSDGPAPERHAKNLKSALDNDVFCR